MKVRRVATGQTADGKSVVVSDEQLEPITVSLLPARSTTLSGAAIHPSHCQPVGISRSPGPGFHSPAVFDSSSSHSPRRPLQPRQSPRPRQPGRSTAKSCQG